MAESRHVTQVHTLIAEAAVFEAVKMRRALGDVSEVTTVDLWDRMAEDMSMKLYRPWAWTWSTAPGAAGR